MQLKHDTELQGNHARYVVIDCLGRGAFSMTYTARVSAIQAPRPEIEIGMLVVVKTPTLDLGRSYYDKEHRLAALHVEATANYRSLQRLRGLDCVAGALDFGAIPVKLGQGVDSPAFFIVQEYVEGERFDRFLQTLFHAGEKYVIGASAFFDWARKISESLLKVHQRGVIHGDLWPENIMVRDAQPVLIDFGQGVFRDFPLTQTTLLSRPHDYLAPERLRAAGERLGSTWYVAADIYSLGGVLFYLATGEDPPSPRLRQCQDVDATKTLIVQELEARNPDLYNEDHGVADIIARCLRRDQHTRYGVVQEVLRDIDVFSNNYGKSQVKDALEAVAGIGRVLKEGDVETSLFTLIAMEQLVQLKRHVEDMETGVYDLIGDHRVLTPALSAYLSILEAGDKYFTVTVPSFWHPEKNLGINGRFLSMNYDIGMRGVVNRDK
jgi:serine/threonine protein kinase